MNATLTVILCWPVAAGLFSLVFCRAFHPVEETPEAPVLTLVR